MSPPRVMFVDDDRGVLDALRNRLYRHRAQWDLHYESDGGAALAAQRAAPFALVVTDLRMPGLEGLGLLSALRAEYPATARVILSGHGDRDTIVRALPMVHQLLSKPCAGAALRDALENGVRLAALGVSPEHRALLGGVAGLPFDVSVAAELAAAVARRPDRAAELTAIAERCPGLSAKLMQLGSSPYFGLEVGAATIAQAVTRIGGLQISELVLSRPNPTAVIANGRRVQAATLARRWLGAERGDLAYAAALLHDCATLVVPGLPAEHRASASAALLAIWGLPRTVTDAVRWHRDLAAAPLACRELATAVHLAVALAEGPTSPAIDDAAIAQIGLTAQVSAWCEAA